MVMSEFGAWVQDDGARPSPRTVTVSQARREYPSGWSTFRADEFAAWFACRSAGLPAQR
jgi:hypothetical protein